MYVSGGLRGASIIDSLDTLYIMGLMDEYNDAKEWVKTSLDLNSVRAPLHSLCPVGDCFKCTFPAPLNYFKLSLQTRRRLYFQPDKDFSAGLACWID